jgi:polysaccharide biosynthesis/export protein
MKNIYILLITGIMFLTSCTSSKKLMYLNNLPEANGEESFSMTIPDYKIQPRDILFISAKAMSPEGIIVDFLASGRSAGSVGNMQYESNQYIAGYDVDSRGKIALPVIGDINASGFTLEELKDSLQEKVEKIFPGTTVECKLLSFKFTVIGEIRVPGTYVNYNNYLTVLEAIGRAGGIADFGRKDNVLVVRATENGTKTFRINLQDKKILSSEAYYLLPNDVVIVEPEKHKIFNLNLPTITFTISAFTGLITTTLLLINFFGK